MLFLSLACFGGTGPGGDSVSGSDRVSGSDSLAVDSDRPGCIDADGDGYGIDCGAGDDCDDAVASCTDDCSDADASGTADCAESVGAGVFVYTGSDGDNWDTNLPKVLEVYEDGGVAVASGDALPADLLDSYGVLIVLNPLAELDASVAPAATSIVARGGRLVYQTEHGGYGGHEQANQVLGAVGSSMRSVEASLSGRATATLESVPPLTDGVSALSPYYTAYVDVGQGTALAREVGSGTPDSGDGDWVLIGYEAVGRGDVVLVADTSMFGYTLADDDNARFILNLADLD